MVVQVYIYYLRAYKLNGHIGWLGGTIHSLQVLSSSSSVYPGRWFHYSNLPKDNAEFMMFLAKAPLNENKSYSSYYSNM